MKKEEEGILHNSVRIAKSSTQLTSRSSPTGMFVLFGAFTISLTFVSILYLLFYQSSFEFASEAQVKKPQEIVQLDTSIIVHPNQKEKWPESFRKCMNSQSIDNKLRKHKISIIQTVSNDRFQVSEEFNKSTSIMSCYCKKWGCNHQINHFDNKLYPEIPSFFSKRWAFLRENSWYDSEWIIGADLDVLPVNFSRNITQWIHEAEMQGKSMIMNVQSNSEPVSSFIAFKTRDLFATCFMDRWVELGKISHKGTYSGNYDNGDLYQIFTELVDPDTEKSCKEVRENDYWAYEDCNSGAFRFFVESDVGNASFKRTEIEGIPIKIEFPLEGAWRWLWSIDNDNQLISSEWFIHGWKDMGKYFYNAIHECRNEKGLGKLYPDDLVNEKDNLLVWKTEKETLDYAIKSASYHFPGCRSVGKNVCFEKVDMNCQKKDWCKSGGSNRRFQGY